jgi:hypothetical protein
MQGISGHLANLDTVTVVKQTVELGTVPAKLMEPDG